jgi:mono/diheme cytochrome c family protein
MRRVQLMFGVLGAALAAFAAHTVAAAELPDGPNRALVAAQCGACHDVQPLLDAAGVSREDWDGALEEMTGYGLKVTPEQRAQILEYLATYLGPSANVVTFPKK